MTLWFISSIHAAKYGGSPNVITWIVAAVSMLIIIFSMEDAILFKTMYNYLRKKIRKVVMIFIGIVVFAIIMRFLIPYTFNTYPVIFIIGFISFAFTILITALTSLIYMFIFYLKMKKRHPEFSLECKLLPSGFKGGIEYQRRYREITENDPVLHRMSKIPKKIILYGLLIWLIILLVVIVITLQENSFLNKANEEALAVIL